MHSSVPNQFFQSIDYQFFVSEGHNSLSNPGLLECFNEIEKLKKSNHSIFFLKYEDLTGNPNYVQSVLNSSQTIKFSLPFKDFHKSDIPRALKVQLNGFRPLENKKLPAWTESERIERVHEQIKLYPIIEHIAKEWGYPTFNEVVKAAGVSESFSGKDAVIGTIIAFHTNDNLYKNEANRLRKSLERLGLPHHIEEVSSSKDSWVENCAMKPNMIIAARRKLKGPLLYVDVDAFFHSDPWPYLSQYNGDIAVYMDKTGLLISGTIFINDTLNVLSLLMAWSDLQKKNSKIYDQEVLRQIVEKEEMSLSSKYKIQKLPVNFNYIFDKKIDYISGDVIIEHLQASRESSRKWGEVDSESAALIRRKARIKELEQ